MPLFFFNLSGRTTLSPPVGENFPSLVYAIETAVDVANDLARNKRHEEVSGNDVIVVEASGEEVFRMPLRRLCK
jgi:hypothetical protein